MSASTPTTRKRVRVALPAFALAVIAALIGPGVATAAPSSLFDTPAADQYVESVPTSDGPSVGRKARTAPLPPAAQTALRREGGQSASQLEQVATSSHYGAPQRKLKRDSDPRSPSISSAAVSALGDDTGSDMRWLLIALLASTALVLGAVGYQHRKRKAAG